MISFLSVSTAQFSITQLTNNEYDDGSGQVQINANGHVVWSGCDSETCNNPIETEIFLYDGTSTAQLTNDTYSDSTPQINDNGYVVWRQCPPIIDGSTCEILLYDGTTTTQLTDNSHNNKDPQINDNGHVAWFAFNQGIFLYDGTSTIQIPIVGTYEPHPRLNNNGHLVWRGSGSGIFLYDGTSTTQITSAADVSGPQINDNGHVVWSQYDGSDPEIFLYDGMSIIQITDNTLNEASPRINNNGYVVWDACDTPGPLGCTPSIPPFPGGDGDEEIFLYDGTDTIQLSNNKYYELRPLINANGVVVWTALIGLSSEIFLHDGTSTVHLTAQLVHARKPEISDNGHVVWSGFDGYYPYEVGDWEVFLAVPCSFNEDNDGDGYVSSACGGDDCDDFNPYLNLECGGSCTESAEASTYGGSSVYRASDLWTHLTYLLLPLCAMIVLRLTLKWKSGVMPWGRTKPSSRFAK
jgi:hypothetical protein